MAALEGCPSPARARWPLTAAQRGVWVAQQLDPANPRYNCGGYLDLVGALDQASFERALRRAFEETQVLHMRFEGTASDLWQTPRGADDAACGYHDLRQHQDPADVAEEWMRADLGRAYDLRRGPLFHQALLRIAEDRYFLYVRYHHILMDGFGQTLYLRRVAQLYAGFVSGTPGSERACGSVADLLEEEASYRRSPQFEADRQYWQNAFADVPERLSLGGGTSGSDRSFRRRSAVLPASTTQTVVATARGAGVRWSAVVLAATAAYLSRVAGVEDVVVGLPVTARTTSMSLCTPCMQANELPLRLRVLPTMSLRDLIAHVRAQVSRLLKHQRYRGEDLHREIERLGSGRALAGIVLNVVSFDQELSFPGCRATAHHLSSGPVRELAMDVYGNADGSRIQINFDANAALFGARDLQAHHERFIEFLAAFAASDLELPVHKVALTSPEERRRLLEGFNATQRPYDLSKSLHTLVHEQVRRSPDATAVAVEGEHLTYRELDELSDRLAAHLQALGVGAGQLVGVYEQRSLELVVDLLAVLKAGAAYVPLDPEAPIGRIAFQLQDAGIKLVLSRASLCERLTDQRLHLVAVDERLRQLPEARPAADPTTPESAAYVIYTSGSTGQPKGVVVPHRGVVNRLLWMQEHYGLTADDCVLQKTPTTFDVSVWEFFWPLLAGSRLFLAAPGEHRDPRALARTIEAQGVTTLHFVPPMLDLFLAEPEAAATTSLRRVICSGEALHPETVKVFFELFDPHEVELHNLYGPTEASIDVTSWRCSPSDAARGVPIGHPVANTRLYVLDPHGQPTPIGVPGELFIGGVQVAAGYLNRPELMRERFVPNPFGEGTLYRTGDLACWRDDGALLFLGRLDHQVKIRGVRIELAEVEAALRLHNGVEQSVVTVWEHARNDRRLIGYVVPKSGIEVHEEDVARFVTRQLPEAMVPAHIMVLDALPLSPNGKIDRRALPTPSVDPRAPAGPPQTAQEALLCRVWQEVLGLRHVGVEDSFFGLGGDSMLGIRTRNASERYGWTFALQDLFRFPTLRELARHLRPVEAESLAPEPTPALSTLRPEDREKLPEGIDDAFGLSAMQAGMLFHTDYEDESSVYRVVTSLHLALPFDEDVLKAALAQTARRHPSLRTSFELSRYSEPLQLVHREVSIPLEAVHDLSALTADEQHHEIALWMERKKLTRFDPAVPPLLTFAVHKRGPSSFQLSVVEHHAVLDGWSDAIMLGEILARYRAGLAGQDLWLPEIPSTMRAYVAQERRVLADERARAFWTTRLKGVASAPLPRKTSHARGKLSASHRAFHVPLRRELADGLRALAKQHELPLKAILAAAHIAVMRLMTNATEVVTGVIANGRLEQEGGDEVIGVFLNTLPVRIDTTSKTWLDLAGDVFAYERDCAPYRRYPVAQIQRDLAGALELDSYVNFMDFHQPWNNADASDRIVESAMGLADTNFPLAVNFLLDPSHAHLSLWLDCDLSVLDETLCSRLTGYYTRALEAMVHQPKRFVLDAELLGRDELARVAQWNDTLRPYDEEATIHGLIEQQVERSPNAVAVAYRGVELRYAELNARANLLASRLRCCGVREGGIVGVSVRRSTELVVALLAVLKSGAAYVPLDPDFPTNRLEFIAADAGIDCLVTDGGTPTWLDAARVPIVDVSTRVPAERVETPPACVSGEDRAYLIYTSGSTGKPKGTGVRHRNVVNFFAGMDDQIGCGAEDVILAVTSVSFDISVLELLWPLTHGAKVVVAGEGVVANLVPRDVSPALEHDDEPLADPSFAELCQRHGVTLLQSTPSLLAAVTAEHEALRALAGGRAVLVGGEAFPVGLAERLVSQLPGTRIFNMYGPTETTIWSSVHELDPVRDVEGGTIPIGRPIANTELLILDDQRRLVPIGVAGELWIGGAGVAIGYHGQPELTADRFCMNVSGDAPMYRTGDRARWRSDGSVEFFGRLDRQVKIRGHRIEPDEIESVLSRHPQVTSVAVVAVAKPTGFAELVAFVAPSPELAADSAESAHVEHWGEVWDSAYAESLTADDGTTDRTSDDFSGWNSSYTATAIPAEEMREWLSATVHRIEALKPRAVIDVGVGVGLVLQALAPHVQRYHGFDVSPAAVRTAHSRLAKRLGQVPEHVSLVCGDATALGTIEAGAADTVIFNSVIQYFPSCAYLQRALHDALRIVGPDGAVFIGDVRDLELLQAFHATVQLHRSPGLTPAGSIAAAVARSVAAERELCVSSMFFRSLSERSGGSRQVRIELKRGRTANEMTSFRYDVTLLRAAPSESVAGCESVAWDALPGRPASLSGLSNLLERTQDGLEIRVTGIANSRLAKPLQLVRLLDEATATTTAWDLERMLWEHEEPGLDPEDVVALGERFGRAVQLLVPERGHLERFDAVFAPKEVC